MKLAVFSRESKFLTSWNDHCEWSLDTKEALLHDSNEIEGKEGGFIETGSTDAYWVNPDNFRIIEQEQAVQELCTFIDGIIDGDVIANMMTNIVGGEWKNSGIDGSIWICDGREMDGDNILEIIKESTIEPKALVWSLNDANENIFYWIDSDERINSTPAPDYDNFRAQMHDLAQQMESLTAFHMQVNGLKSEDCQSVYLQQQISGVDMALNGTEVEDVKSFNDF